MLSKLIHYIARKRHPWREMRFDELAEIYTSMTLRSFGFSLIGIFVPVYLYTSGVSVQGVLLFLVLHFAWALPISVAVGYIIGRIGPKHTLALSTLFVVVFLAMLLTYDIVRWPLSVLAFVFSVANNLFFIAYNTDFSKVKDKKNGGKELGWLYVFERIGNTLGPIVGGVLGSLWAPEATIACAVIVLLASLVPLFLTNEPVKLHYRVAYRNFALKKHVRNYMALSAFGVQSLNGNWIWPLLVAVFIFTEDTYAKVGGVVGLTMGISIVSAHMYGKFIDNKRGLSLLRYGTVMNLVLDGLKAATTSASGAVAVSALGEPVGLAYRMPLVKAVYDEADGADNYRVVYFVWAEIWTAFFKMLFTLGLLVGMHVYSPIAVLRVGFIIAPIFGLIMLTQRFPALKK